ncbi:hypothetical protein, partial [Pseudoalteromonas spongiae]|uniref:hypothetical protein n=1 Tax=Pseudoalteromonas spongiae TaxID=298657 RepID=UPI001282146C
EVPGYASSDADIAEIDVDDVNDEAAALEDEITSEELDEPVEESLDDSLEESLDDSFASNEETQGELGTIEPEAEELEALELNEESNDADIAEIDVDDVNGEAAALEDEIISEELDEPVEE